MAEFKDTHGDAMFVSDKLDASGNLEFDSRLMEDTHGGTVMFFDLPLVKKIRDHLNEILGDQ